MRKSGSIESSVSQASACWCSTLRSVVLFAYKWSTHSPGLQWDLGSPPLIHLSASLVAVGFPALAAYGEAAVPPNAIHAVAGGAFVFENVTT